MARLDFLVLNQLPADPARAIFASRVFQYRVQPCAAGAIFEGKKMANNDDDVPFMQKLLDNPFLLLALGVLTPTVLYTLWGVVDIMRVPLAK